MAKTSACPACNGTGCQHIGETMIDEPCPECAGEGTDPNVDDDGYDDWDYGLDDYEEPPLYENGQLEAMTPEQLIAERDRQCRIHDCAVDRCEEINSPTIETAAARHRLVERELERRGYSPYADTPEKMESK